MNSEVREIDVLCKYLAGPGMTSFVNPSWEDAGTDAR